VTFLGFRKAGWGNRLWGREEKGRGTYPVPKMALPMVGTIQGIEGVLWSL
jgi:hypothetical protein